ncbi:zinc finger protein 513a isoform X2 [Gouania willdenowi]|nr:zinc finger protein 513 isoform X2 [Gouania willdenowi]XP_028295945.1 zinc finger protein 513 isoform X2 [Gouania willdenowi]
MESETDNSRSTTDNGREDEGRALQAEPPFPPYLSCRGCGQLRDEHLGPGIDLVGPYCLRCYKNSREAKNSDFGSHFGNMSGMRSSSHQDLDCDGDDDSMSDKDQSSDDKNSKLHSCHICGFSSRYANHVKRHLKTHNGEKPYNCPLCTYASAQLVNLQRHLRIHTGEKPYKCESCTFACSSLGNLKRHQRMHNPSAVPLQDVMARPPMVHNTGKRQMSGQRSAEDMNDASSKEVARAASHISLGPHNSDYMSAFDSIKAASPPHIPPSNPSPGHHSSPLLETTGSSGGGRGGRGAVAQGPNLASSLFPYTCRLCGIVLEDEDGSSAQICAKCTLEMLTKDSSSSPNSPGERSDKVYTCAACPFLTHYPNHLARHMKTHSGEKPYKCPQCDYASAHFDNLKRHHRVHTGEKPYKCHLCDYACGNLANLKRHQRVHSGAKPFQCPVCNYTCNQSMNLKRHMLRHSGEKPYKCQECGYTTGHWDNYKRHQKKHGLNTDGWVKVPMTPSSDEAGARKSLEASSQTHRKDGAAALPYMPREGGQNIHPCYKLEIA